jgi:hypothetical protein
VGSDFTVVLHAVAPFVLGLAFTTLVALQSGHSVHGLWVRAFGTSLCLGSIQFMIVGWAAHGSPRFWIFQCGASVGAALGSVLCRRLGQMNRYKRQPRSGASPRSV